MELGQALEFARTRHQGVLVTRRPDGRPHLSNLAYSFGDSGVARISVTATRVKTRNLRADPTTSLYVPGDSFWAYVVLDGTAELSEVAADPHDATVDELVEVYREVTGGDHPDWEEFRAAMVADERLVVRFRPERSYGQLPA